MIRCWKLVQKKIWLKRKEKQPGRIMNKRKKDWFTAMVVFSRSLPPQETWGTLCRQQICPATCHSLHISGALLYDHKCKVFAAIINFKYRNVTGIQCIFVSHLCWIMAIKVYRIHFLLHQEMMERGPSMRARPSHHHIFGTVTIVMYVFLFQLQYYQECSQDYPRDPPLQQQMPWESTSSCHSYQELCRK